MKEIIILIMAGILSVIYNIMALGAYSLHEDAEFKTICLAFIIANTIKDAILFGMILNSIFLGWLRGGGKMEEQVNKNVSHPSHYNQGIEAIDIIESWDLNFSLGNAIKYILRSPYKGKQIEDLEKARWYIDREINRLKDEEAHRKEKVKSSILNDEKWRDDDFVDYI